MSNNIITIKYYSFMHEFHRRLCATIVELKAWMSNEIPQKTIMRKYQSMPQCQLICKMVPGERLLEVSRPSHCSVNEYRTIRGLSWVTILGHNWDDLAWISLVTASLSRFFFQWLCEWEHYWDDKTEPLYPINSLRLLWRSRSHWRNLHTTSVYISCNNWAVADQESPG